MPSFNLDQLYAIAHTVIEAGIFFWALGKRADKALIEHMRMALKEDFMTRHEGRRILHKLDQLLERRNVQSKQDPA
jgi:hypothetical protein